MLDDAFLRTLIQNSKSKLFWLGLPLLKNRNLVKVGLRFVQTQKKKKHYKTKTQIGLLSDAISKGQTIQNTYFASAEMGIC